MTHHTMILSEPHPSKPGFSQRYYATIDIYIVGPSWFWIQVDWYGKFLGTQHGPFTTDAHAKADALSNLNGLDWE